MSSSDEELAAFWTARLDEAEAAANAGARRVGMSWRAEPQPGTPGGLVIDDLGLVGSTGGRYAADHIALHDPARVLREVGADRDLLAALKQAREYSDRVFGPAPPGNIASGEWLSERMRAATQVLVLEQVAKIRAAVYSDHPDYQERWRP